MSVWESCLSTPEDYETNGFCGIQQRNLTEEGLAQTWYDACRTAAAKAVCFWHLAFVSEVPRNMDFRNFFCSTLFRASNFTSPILRSSSRSAWGKRSWQQGHKSDTVTWRLDLGSRLTAANLQLFLKQGQLKRMPPKVDPVSTPNWSTVENGSSFLSRLKNWTSSVLCTSCDEINNFKLPSLFASPL